jgi:alkylhydroperoxidase family enzyme
VSTTPLVAIPEGRYPELFSALSHNPEFHDAFAAMYAEIFNGGVLDIAVIEAIRLRVARTSGCGL